MDVIEYVRDGVNLYGQNIAVIEREDRKKINDLILEMDDAIKRRDVETLQRIIPQFRNMQNAFKPGGPNITDVISKYNKPSREPEVINKVI